MAREIPATMRAMVLEAFGQPLVERTVPVPTPGPEDALVRVRACGVCGTDLKITGGKMSFVKTPHIPGHEPAGEVVAVGAEVESIKVGDHVAVVIFLNCGACDYCRTGREQICPHLRGRVGFTIDGAYAEYLCVPASALRVVAPDVPFEAIALLGDCITTAWNAISVRANVQPGQWLYMTGAGGIGLHAIQLARLRGARVIAVDVDDEKLAIAQRFGADLTLNVTRDDVVARVRETVGGDGVDVAVDFVASQAALDADFAVLRPDGAVILVGYNPDGPSQVRTMDIALNEYRLIGSRASGLKELDEMIAMIEEKRIEPVISRTYALAEVNLALDDLRQGRVIGRAVVLP
ncbi:MAG: alcohol dehydrogenase catalytic domain-containing protein [Nitrososphaerota archaeon]